MVSLLLTSCQVFPVKLPYPPTDLYPLCCWYASLFGSPVLLLPSPATPISPQRVVGLVSLVVMTAIELVCVLIGGLVFIGISIRTLRRMSR